MVDEGNPDGTQFWMLLSSPCQQFFAVLLIAQGVLRLYNFAPMVRELDAELGLQIFFWTVYIRIAVLIVPTNMVNDSVGNGFLPNICHGGCLSPPRVLGSWHTLASVAFPRIVAFDGI